MIGILLGNINIRSEMSTVPGTDMGDLKIGDVVIGTVINGWIAFDRVYRKALNGQAEALGHTRYAAVHELNNPAVKYMMLVDVNISTPVPTPVPVIDPLRISVDGGDIYESASLELKPKA